MYFKKISSLEDLKRQYRELALANHPDAGGNAEAMKEINSEYDVLFPIWRNKHNQSAPVQNTETARSTRNDFYTQNGWKGDNYDRNLSTTDIAKLIRQYVKKAYPLYKFSVTSKYFSGGSSISVALMEAPHPVFAEGKEPKDGHVQSADTYFEQRKWAFGDEPRCVLTGQAIAVLRDVQDFMNSYNMKDCDGMIDYFHVNFWDDLDIGKWDKPFMVVEKTPRGKSRADAADRQSLSARLAGAKQEATQNKAQQEKPGIQRGGSGREIR